MRSPFRAVLLVDEPEALREFLGRADVASRSFFYPLHRQPCFADFEQKQGGPMDLDDAHYPNAIFAFEHSVCLPVFPTLEDVQIDYVCDLVREFFDKR